MRGLRRGSVIGATVSVAILLSSAVAAQTTASVTGIVSNAATNAPVELISVRVHTAYGSLAGYTNISRDPTAVSRIPRPVANRVQQRLGGISVRVDPVPCRLPGPAATIFSDSRCRTHYIFDWSTLTNGPHTIGWLITDNCNRAEGVGRFFNVATGTSAITAAPAGFRLKAETTGEEGAASAFGRNSADEEASAFRRNDAQSPILVARGYGELPVIVERGDGGDRTIEVKQGERIQVRVPPGFVSAYQLVAVAQMRALPIGSTWEANGRILVAGGTNWGGDLASAEIYDPAAGTWSFTSSMAVARVAGTGTRLPNGAAMVAGGYAPFPAGAASAELYDPISGTWSFTGSMGMGRIGHTATLMPDGKVLAAGGYAPQYPDVPPAAELYDSVLGTWSPAASMSTGRVYASATLLFDGGVLLAGGVSDIISSVYLASAEVFNASPTNENQCKNGGWATFTSPRIFKNQGDCIQFVNTGR